MNSTKTITSDLSKVDADKIGGNRKKAQGTEMSEGGNTKKKGKANGRTKAVYKDNTDEEDEYHGDESRDDDDDAYDEVDSEDGVDDEESGETPSLTSPQGIRSPPASVLVPGHKRKRTEDEYDGSSDAARETSSRLRKRTKIETSRSKQPLHRPTNAGKALGRAALAADGCARRPQAVSDRLLTGDTGPIEVIDVNDDHDSDSDDSSMPETDSDPEEGDYRHIDPIDRPTDAKDQATIRRALELTRIDFFQKTGNVVPQNLANDFCYESYASQHKHIQEVYREHRKYFAHTPKLYRLPAWKYGFSKVCDISSFTSFIRDIS